MEFPTEGASPRSLRDREMFRGCIHSFYAYTWWRQRTVHVLATVATLQRSIPPPGQFVVWKVNLVGQLLEFLL